MAPRLHRGIPVGTENQVADLYWDAFGRKLGLALGPADRGRAFLAAHLNRDRGVTAIDDDGRILGVAGYHLAGRALAGGSARDVVSSYGLLSGPGRLAILALLARKQSRDVLLMDGICVAAQHRGLGIGSLLLNEVVVIAAENSCSQVRLDVVDVNPRAKALYQRHGFTAVRTQNTPFLRKLMGFGAVTTMQRRVSQ